MFRFKLFSFQFFLITFILIQRPAKSPKMCKISSHIVDLSHHKLHMFTKNRIQKSKFIRLKKKTKLFKLELFFSQIRKVDVKRRVTMTLSHGLLPYVHEVP